MAINDRIISGGKQLDDFLKTLAPDVEKNIMRSALAAGARVIAKEIKARAPVGPPSSKNAAIYGGYAGALRDSVRVSSKVGKGGNIAVSVKVGGKTKKGAQVYYARMVEFGTRPHWIKVEEGGRPWRNTRRGVKALSIGTLNRMAARGSLTIGGNFVGSSVSHPGTRAQPFVRPGFDASVGPALKAIVDQIRKRLTKAGVTVPAPDES